MAQENMACVLVKPENLEALARAVIVWRTPLERCARTWDGGAGRLLKPARTTANALVLSPAEEFSY